MSADFFPNTAETTSTGPRLLRRLKRKAKKLYHWCKNAIKYANNLTCCSCPSCGNPRRHFGQKTRRERDTTSPDDWET